MKHASVINLLRKHIFRAGSLSAFARERSLSKSRVSDVVNGKREPSDKVLAAIGLERVVTYRKTTA